jgi:hypothetical protein
MNPDFQVYAKILKFALIYRNEEGTGLVLTVLQDWCFFYALPKEMYRTTSIHVVDHTIKPILLYGCEIWGYFNPFTSRFRNGNIPIDQFFLKEPELLNHIPKYLQRDTHSKLLF